MKYRAEIVRTVRWTEEVEAPTASEAEDLLAERHGDPVPGSQVESEEVDYDSLVELP